MLFWVVVRKMVKAFLSNSCIISTSWPTLFRKTPASKIRDSEIHAGICPNQRYRMVLAIKKNNPTEGRP